VSLMAPKWEPSTSPSLNLDRPRARKKETYGTQRLNQNNEIASSLTKGCFMWPPLLTSEKLSIDRVMARISY